METKQRHFSIAYLIAAMIVLFLIQSFLFAPHPENLAYSDFKALLAKEKVSDLTIDKPTITGTLAASGLEGLLPKPKLDELKRYGKGEHRFTTTRVADPEVSGQAKYDRFTFLIFISFSMTDIDQPPPEPH